VRDLRSQKYTRKGQAKMKPIAYHPDYRKIGHMSKKGYAYLENTTQKHLYAMLLKGTINDAYERPFAGRIGKWTDEFTIWVLRDKKMNWETREVVAVKSEVLTYTGFVGEFNSFEGQNGWHLYLTDGKDWIYHNDHDETEYDQLLCVRINRKKVDWAKNIKPDEKYHTRPPQKVKPPLTK